MANLLTGWARYNKQEVRTLIVGSICVSKSADSNGKAITNLGANAFAKGSAVKIVRGGSEGNYTYTVTDCTTRDDADYIVAADFETTDTRLEAYVVKSTDIDNLVAR